MTLTDLVAAKTYTPSKPSAPSMAVSSWLTTRSVTPVLSCPLLKQKCISQLGYPGGDPVILPFRCDRVKFVKEQHARFRCYRSCEDVPHLIRVRQPSFSLQVSQRQLTDFSLAPIYLFNNSGPFTLMKLRPHSLATAEARSVLPQPG